MSGQISEKLYGTPVSLETLAKLGHDFTLIFDSPALHCSCEDILSQELNNPRQRTIHLDCLRTRS